MKEKEGFVDCPEQQMIIFVEKEDGQYGPIQTGSYITKHYIDDFFEKRTKLIQSLKQKVENQEISPIHFFMVLEDLTLQELSSRTHISIRKVRKHLLFDRYIKMTDKQLEPYALVFHLTVEQLRKLDTTHLEQPNTESEEE
jgi:hypothetical protein